MSSRLLFHFWWSLLLAFACFNIQSSLGTQFLCGSALPDTLDLICKNGFGKKTKRSIDPMDYYTDLDENIPSPFEQAPFMSKAPLNAIAEPRRMTHGVFEECCRKPCSLDELKEYCL